MSFSNINIPNYLIEKRLIKGESLLDIGSGHGALAYLMQRDKTYCTIHKTAMEIDPSAKEFNDKHKLYESFMTPKDLKINKKFDSVVALELMEHLTPNNPSMDDFLHQLESMANKIVIISVPAPYMTFSKSYIKNKLKFIQNKDVIDDDITIEILADTHKQIISPSYLKANGYKAAFNSNIFTISGSIIYYKNIQCKTKKKQNLSSMLYPIDYLNIAKKYYANNDLINNKDFLLLFLNKMKEKSNKKYCSPLYPSVIYYLKVFLFNLLKGTSKL